MGVWNLGHGRTICGWFEKERKIFANKLHPSKILCEHKLQLCPFWIQNYKNICKYFNIIFQSSRDLGQSLASSEGLGSTPTLEKWGIWEAPSQEIWPGRDLEGKPCPSPFNPDVCKIKYPHSSPDDVCKIKYISDNQCSTYIQSENWVFFLLLHKCVSYWAAWPVVTFHCANLAGCTNKAKEN